MAFGIGAGAGGANGGRQPVAQGRIPAAEKQPLVGVRAAVNGDNPSALGDQRQALWLIESMARQMQGMEIILWPKALEQV